MNPNKLAYQLWQRLAMENRNNIQGKPQATIERFLVSKVIPEVIAEMKKEELNSAYTQGYKQALAGFGLGPRKEELIEIEKRFNEWYDIGL